TLRPRSGSNSSSCMAAAMPGRPSSSRIMTRPIGSTTITVRIPVTPQILTTSCTLGFRPVG
ncbi:hypothetical protein FS749_003329, partial [Ceratobasidium sp. UAMH 11750]